MMSLRKYLDKIKPNFEAGGKLHAFQSVFEGLETFLFVPNTTATTGTNIHDAIDSKRIMSFVVIALLPALLFGIIFSQENWRKHRFGVSFSMAHWLFFRKLS